MRTHFIFFFVVAAAGDDSSMLQVEVESSQSVTFAIQNIGEQLAALNLPGPGTQLSINAMMKTLSKSNSIDASEREILETINATLVQALDIFLNQKYARDVDMNAIYNQTAQCNTQGVAADNDNKVETEAKRVAHVNAREVEQLAWVEENQVCLTDGAFGVMGDLWTTANNQCNWIPHYDPVGGWPWREGAFQDPFHVTSDKIYELTTEFESQLSPLIDAFKNVTGAVATIETCQTAWQDLKDKKAAANSLQNQFEVEFCKWMLSRKTMCADRAVCMATKDAAHQALWAAVDAEQSLRAKQACLIEKIQCYIVQLIESGSLDIENPACKINQTMQDNCDATYGNENVDVPPMEDCDESVVNIYPGTPDWVSTYYDPIKDENPNVEFAPTPADICPPAP